ncbi:TonB family protein [Hymenobacter sp. CRA2]|uniref:TonB family protein n=1 Tax=Hymenobacter sp. CRA2 TaxID=1955620 RepID=UPI0009CC85E1|nr:TonB family protein [Hymenobacter sp. CRA2]OON70509.1 hypothetical protein B0919_00305 [Hymenobacter sp. CRA2]
MPKFHGGGADSALAYLRRHMEYPAEAVAQRLEGRVFVSFIVNAAGAVEQAQVVKGSQPLLDAEALRAVQAMPAWEPGRQNGRPVSVVQTLPILFRLPTVQPLLTSPRPATQVHMPRPVGGQAALEQHVKTKLPYPEAARQAQASALVFVRVDVDSLGQVTGTRLMTLMHDKQTPKGQAAQAKQLQQELTDAALAGLRTGLTWQPGQRNSQPVRSNALVPVLFDGKAGTVGLLPQLRLFPDELPAVEGGNASFAQFLAQNIRYPADALRARMQGKVLMLFEVSETGRVENPLIIQSVYPSIDAEALRVAAQLPPMHPALEQGRPVRSFFVAPITFSLKPSR